MVILRLLVLLLLLPGLAHAAMAPIPVTFYETASLARSGEISYVAVPIPFPDHADTPTSTLTSLALRTASGSGTCVDFQLGADDVHVRWWGAATDTAKRIKAAMLTAAVTVSANSFVTLYLDNSGACSATAGITTSVVSNEIEVDTNEAGRTTGVQNVRIPASSTAAQNLINRADLWTGAAYESVISPGNLGGLCISGIAGDTQTGDYCSHFETANQHTVAIVRSGPLWTVVRIGRSTWTVNTGLKLKDSGGTAFEGKRNEGANSAGTGVQIRTDVYLHFYRGFPGWKTVVVNHGTERQVDTSDLAIEKFWLRIIPEFSGTSTVLTVRDEGAASKLLTVTASSASTVRQTVGYNTPIAANGIGYTFGLTATGALSGALNANSVTMLEAVCHVQRSDNKWGVAIAIRHWREKFPAGCAYDPSTGALDGEFLNPTQDDIQKGTYSGITANRTHHVQLGSQKPKLEAWTIFNVGARNDTTLKETVKKSAGWHPSSVTQAATATMTIATPAVVTYTGHGLTTGSTVTFTTTGALPTGITSGTRYYVITAGLTANTFRVSATDAGTAINTSGTQSGTHTATANPIEGTQRYPLVGLVGANASGHPIWEASQVWDKHMPPPKSALPTTNAVSTSTALYAGTRVDTTWDRQDKWTRSLIDRTMTADATWGNGQLSLYTWCARVWSHSGPCMGWRNFISYPGHGNNLEQYFGAAYYNIGLVPGLQFIAQGHLYPVFLDLFHEMVTQGVAFTQYHCSGGAFCGGVYHQGAGYHWHTPSPANLAKEVTQQFDWVALAWLMTGDPYFKEALLEHGAYIDAANFGAGGGTGTNRSKSGSTTCTFTNGSGSVTGCASTANFSNSNNYEIQWGINETTPGCTITSVGTTVTCTGHGFTTGASSSALGTGVCLTGGDADACTTSNDNLVRRIIAVTDANTLTIDSTWPGGNKTGASWQRVTHVDHTPIFNLTVTSGSTLTISAASYRTGVHVIRTRVGDATGGIRAQSWPMLSLVRMCQMFSDAAPDTDSCLKARQLSEHISYRAKQSGDATTNAAFGGMPGHVNSMIPEGAAEANDCMGGVFHQYTCQEATQTQYPLKAFIHYYDLSNAARTCASPCTPLTTQFTQTAQDDAAAFLKSWTLLHAGDGVTWTKYGPQTVLGTAAPPFIRAGHMLSATQFSLFAYPYGIVTGPTSANARIFTTTSGLSTSFADWPLQATYDTGTSGTVKNNAIAGRGLLSVDTIVWVAETLYPADATRCAYLYNFAKELAAEHFLYHWTENGSMNSTADGTYHNPTNTGLYGTINHAINNAGTVGQSNRFIVRTMTEAHRLASLEASGGLACSGAAPTAGSSFFGLGVFKGLGTVK